MAIIRSTGKYLRTSTLKCRPVVNLVRGKKVEEALNILKFVDKKPARFVEKILRSAIANAKENEKIEDIDSLFIKEIFVNNGPTAKRFMPRARGRACKILKRSSHIKLALEQI
ncbi:MAG: 50S ribosomal protein L22 [bacterium]